MADWLTAGATTVIVAPFAGALVWFVIKSGRD